LIRLYKGKNIRSGQNPCSPFENFSDKESMSLTQHHGVTVIKVFSVSPTLGPNKPVFVLA
jgi:hypothetical protein